MKSFICALWLGCVVVASAADSKPLLVTTGKLVAQPDLKQPLTEPWAVQKGTWTVKDGVLEAVELPEEKHAAVIWHKVGLSNAVIECEFKYDGGKVFIIGCDSAGKHVGRLTISPKSAKIAEDSSEVKGKQPGQTIGDAKLDLKPGEWYPVRFEWSGDRMAARVNGQELQGQHPTLSTKKARWWFAVGGDKVLVRNIKVSGE